MVSPYDSLGFLLSNHMLGQDGRLLLKCKKKKGSQLMEINYTLLLALNMSITQKLTK